MDGNQTIFDLIQDYPWVVCFDLARFGSATVVHMVTAVILLLPVTFEQVGTVSPPRTVWKGAVHEIRDVSQ